MEETNSPQGTPQDAKGMTEEMTSNNGQYGMSEEQHQTLKKALDQRLKYKEAYEAERAEKEKLLQSKLEAEGKHKEAADYWKQKALELEEKDKKRETVLAWNSITSQLKATLASQGCVNPEKAIKLIDRAELKSVEVDENYRVSDVDISRIVDHLKKDNSDIGLFASGVGVKDMSPSSANFDKSKPKQTKQMSKEELDAAWNNLN